MADVSQYNVPCIRKIEILLQGAYLLYGWRCCRKWGLSCQSYHRWSGTQQRDFSHPTGGSAESPGTGAMAIPAMSAGAYAALMLKSLLDLRGQLDEGPLAATPTDKLIY